MTQSLGLLDHLLLTDDLQRADRHRAAQRVAAVRGAVGARLDGEHDVLATQDAGHGVHAAGDGLAQQHQVGLDAAPLVAQELAGAGDAGLDLVADQQGVVLVAQRAGFAQVVVVRDDDAGLALDGLDEEGGDIGAGVLECLAQRSLVVVLERLVGARDVAADVG